MTKGDWAPKLEREMVKRLVDGMARKGWKLSSPPVDFTAPSARIVFERKGAEVWVDCIPGTAENLFVDWSDDLSFNLPLVDLVDRVISWAEDVAFGMAGRGL